MEICSEAVDTKELNLDHSIPLSGEKMKYLNKRPGQAWENDIRKVPKLSCLHLSPNSSTCDPRIFPVHSVNSEVNDVLSGKQMQNHNTLQDKGHDSRTESEMKKLVAQKIAIGM